MFGPLGQAALLTLNARPTPVIGRSSRANQASVRFGGSQPTAPDLWE